MAKLQFFDLLDGYEEPIDEDGKPLPIGKRFFARTLSGSATDASKKRDPSRISKLCMIIARLFTYTKAKIYGLFAVTFGFSVLTLNLLGYYIGFLASISAATLVIGTFLCIIGIPLLFVERPVPIMLQDTSLFDFIFFEFFCIQRVYRKAGEASIHPLVALVLGLLCGVLSCVVSAEIIFSAIAVLLFVCIAFGSPEFAYLTSVLFLPYLGTFAEGYNVFLFVILLAALSFLRKAYQGKRVIYFEKYDLLIFVMIFCILLSGIFIKGMDSFLASASFAVMSLGYLLSSNIITNRRLADRAMNAVVVSAFPISAMVIISYISSSAMSKEILYPAERALFDSTDVLATFLLVAICFSLVHLMQTHAVYKKFSYAIAFIINLSAFLLTGEIFATIALVLGVLSYFAFKLKKPIAVTILVILFMLPVIFYFLPEEIISPIFELVPSSKSYKETVEIIFVSFEMLLHNLVFGIGIGADSFSSEILGQGIIAENSGNLFIELALEAGIFSLVAFVLLLITRIDHKMRYSQYIKNSVLRVSQPIVSLAVMTLVFYGIFKYIWADVSMFYLFFLVFGIESAMLRVSRKDNDERILYFVDARSVDSASIEISIDEQ